MRLTIRHVTTYRYSEPIGYALQQVRTRPRSDALQQVVSWALEVVGGEVQVSFEDQYANLVDLVRLNPDANETVLVAAGVVDTSDTAGVIAHTGGYAPLWLFDRATPHTLVGPAVTELAGAASGSDDLDRLHGLSALVHDAVAYVKGHSDVSSTAEEVLVSGSGVCQDHAHVFLAAARHLGYPARYVSGYLLMDGGSMQDASHAWAEAWVEGLGWVGFDVSNRISPDERYIRLATGRDYTEAAPISGVRFGQGEEQLEVTLQVQQ